MRWFTPKKTKARTGPASTTPNLDRHTSGNIVNTLFSVSIAIVVPVCIMLVFGQPSLRMKYKWNGNYDAPVYSYCLYLTLFDGWREVSPPYAVNNCPLITPVRFRLGHLFG